MMGAGILALLYSYQPLLLALFLALNILITLISKPLFKNYSVAGLYFHITSYVMIGIGLVWGTGFLLSMPVSTITRALLLATTPLLLISLPSGVLKSLEIFDILCREKWLRPKHPYPRRLYSHEPFVSIHVPTYSEPPEMVKETLDKLAKLDYKNYEVIVIDNNTKDRSLRQPVKEHCEFLGEKFRFFHIDNMPGAKGGALNYIAQFVDPRATIVGVIDADYHAEPEFLKALVGHFDNSKLGFVQTPHDYRGWKGNLFLTLCYWEYKIFFHSAMISLSERGAGITVGTMCLIRKEALEKAGGWSEWCVTEDSELAIRIHDVGYDSIYVNTTYGRGLIPDTFEAFKKQRYRWTAGPVQEFRYHLRHFLGLSKRESEFTLTQRLFHLNHGLDNILIGLSVPLQFIGLALVASMIMHGEIVEVPFEMWLAATVMLFMTPLLTIVMNKATVNARLKEIVAQLFAGKALSHTVQQSAFKTTLTGSAAWNRTSKFRSSQSYAAAIYSTKEELTLSLLLAVFVVVSYILFPQPGLTLMLLIGLSYMSLAYMCAPIMSVISIWSLRREQDTDENKTALDISQIYDEAPTLVAAAQTE